VAAGATDSAGRSGPLTYEQVAVGGPPPAGNTTTVVSTTSESVPQSQSSENLLVIGVAVVGVLLTALGVFWRRKELPNFDLGLEFSSEAEGLVDAVIVINVGPGEARHATITVLEDSYVIGQSKEPELTLEIKKPYRLHVTTKFPKKKKWRVIILFKLHAKDKFHERRLGV
jgi:hypothetical protein